MTQQEAIEQLKSLEGDSENSHDEADEILLLVLRSHGLWNVAEEYERTRKRVGFWYA